MYLRYIVKDAISLNLELGVYLKAGRGFGRQVYESFTFPTCVEKRITTSHERGGHFAADSPSDCSACQRRKQRKTMSDLQAKFAKSRFPILHDSKSSARLPNRAVSNVYFD